MHKKHESHQIKVGQFFVKNGIITQAQLDSALLMQKDNPDRYIGEILVTQNVLTREEMIMAFEMYLMVTNATVEHADEWLDQDEVDMLINRIKNPDKT